ADRGAFVGTEAADLHIGGKADADVASLGAEVGLFLAEGLVVGDFDGLVEGLVVVTGVVLRTCEGIERELVRLDEVAAAHFYRIEAGGVGDQVGDALDVVGGLRATGATVGVVRAGVGVDSGANVVEGRNVVAAGRH